MALANSIRGLKKSYNIFSKTTLLHKVLYFLAFAICIILMSNYGRQHVEGFKGKEGGGGAGGTGGGGKEFDMRSNVNQIYDDFYVNIYDDMVFSKNKIDYEIGRIVELTKPTPKSYVLDIGSGTGHHVSALQANGFKAEGIDISPSMVNKAKKTYPDLNYKVADALNMALYPAETFSQITCFYFTLYYIQDKKRLFDNCMKWLIPGGYLSIHLVNRDKFDPIIPAGNPFTIVSPQKYAKKRITTTTVNFQDFEYKSKFDMKESVNSIEDPNAFMIETFKNVKDGGIRKHEHQFYMLTQAEILDIAKDAGFIIHAKVDLLPCQYESQFIYILQKPN
jgi:ubiquinone/menaquinone biosynthesis C-methylase UbiE